MKLKKGNEEIEICDFCLQEKEIRGTASKGHIHLWICDDCFEANVCERFNSIKRLKWYEILYQYKEKGYHETKKDFKRW